MPANPFGALAGETFEGANERVLRQVNLARIERGLPPLKLDLETGEGLNQAMAAFREINMPEQKEQTPRDVRQETSDETVRRILNLLTGLGEVGDVGLGQGGQGQVLLDQLAARSAGMQDSGAAVGIGAGPAQLPGTPDERGALSVSGDAILNLLKMLFLGEPQEFDPGTVANPGQGVEEAARRG